MREQTAKGANKRLVSRLQLGCGSQSITTALSLLVDELDVQSLLHGQMSLAANNHIYERLHKSKERLHKSNGSLKDCFENVNIRKSLPAI